MNYSRFLFSSLAALLISTPGTLAQTASEASTGALEEFLTSLQKNKFKTIDLSHVINNKTPTWSGETNEYQYKKLTGVDKDGYLSGVFSIHEHFGTHVDAPAHFCPGAATVDQITPQHFVLPAIVIDVRNEVAKNADYELSLEKVKEWERAGAIPNGAAVLLLTGWGNKYNSANQYRNPDAKKVMHFPGYSLEAAKYLVEERKVAALGIDTLSIDPGQTEIFPVHNFVLKAGNYMIENMANLDQLPARNILLFCGPLAIEGGSGCPARVLAVIQK